MGLRKFRQRMRALESDVREAEDTIQSVRDNHHDADAYKSPRYQEPLAQAEENLRRFLLSSHLKSKKNT